jgi:hypothetical protein
VTEPQRATPPAPPVRVRESLSPAAAASPPEEAAEPAPASARPARRFAETIVDGALLRRPPTVAVEPERRRPPLAATVAVVLLCGGLAAAGAILGRSLGGGVEQSPQGIAVGGPVALAFPTPHWAPTKAQRLPRLPFRSPVALAARGGAGMLEAGIVPDVGARTLLPAGLRAGEGERVRLGPFAALRYRHARSGRGRLVLYAVPVGRDAAVVACRAAGAEAARTLARCESVAASITLRGVNPSAVGADPLFGASVRSLVRRLDGVRRAERRALVRTGTPFERAGHADVVASAYASAASQLQSLPVPVREQAVQRRLLRALGVARDGYVSLSAALRAGDRAAYVLASRRIAAAERAANAALRALAPLGYAVGPA